MVLIGTTWYQALTGCYCS